MSRAVKSRIAIGGAPGRGERGARLGFAPCARVAVTLQPPVGTLSGVAFDPRSRAYSAGMGSGSARIHLCGRLVVEWDGERLERDLPGRQGRLLFAYLVLNRDRPVRRDELIEALWSEEGPPPTGDSLLAPPLSRLRKAIGASRLEGRGELSLALPDEPGSTGRSHARGSRGRARRSRPATGAARGSPPRRRCPIAEGGLLPGPGGPVDRRAPPRAVRPARRGPRGDRRDRRRHPRPVRAGRGRGGRPPGDRGRAVPRVGPGRADGGPARPRQRGRGADGLRRAAHAADGRARAPRRAPRSCSSTSGC